MRPVRAARLYMASCGVREPRRVRIGVSGKALHQLLDAAIKRLVAADGGFEFILGQN
jgi:hypothetical protein